MTQANPNKNNPVPHPPKPPPGGADGLKVNGPSPTRLTSTQMATAANTDVSCDGSNFNFSADAITGPGLSVQKPGTPMAGTQPCFIVFNSLLCVFWTGIGNDGIWYATIPGGGNPSSWNTKSSPQAQAVKAATGAVNPQVYSDGQFLYVGYTDAQGQFIGSMMSSVNT